MMTCEERLRRAAGCSQPRERAFEDIYLPPFGALGQPPVLLPEPLRTQMRAPEPAARLRVGAARFAIAVQGARTDQLGDDTCQGNLRSSVDQVSLAAANADTAGEQRVDEPAHTKVMRHGASPT